MKLMLRISMTGFVLGLCLGIAHAQPAATSKPQPLITAARVARAEGAMTGAVYATIGGKEIKIADAGVDSWIIQGGRKMVYSGRDGSGGFEDEGMSLHIYDARIAKLRKIMSEYFYVDTVTEVTTSTKKTALLVKLSDGGLGASYFAVVDPNRGEVFFRRWALLLSQKGDTIVLGRYREDDWDKLISDDNAKVTPYRKERYNLNSLLRRRVIQNKRDRH